MKHTLLAVFVCLLVLTACRKNNTGAIELVLPALILIDFATYVLLVTLVLFVTQA